MGAVLEFNDRSIRNLFLLIMFLTTTIVMEALFEGETYELPIFFIRSAIGFSLFWLLEFAARKVVHSENTKQKKNLQKMIFLGRYACLGGLLYFQLNFLFASESIIIAFITCASIFVTFLTTEWFDKKTGNIKDKKTDNIEESETFTAASKWLIVFLTFCIGYFVGKWSGGYWDNTEIEIHIGLVSAVVVACVLEFQMKKQNRDAQKAHSTIEDNSLRLNNDSTSL